MHGIRARRRKVVFLLRIGYLSTLYHTSHLLRHLGWIERETGETCRWFLFATGPEMVRAFGREEIDLGYIGLPPALIGISRGIPLACVAGGHVEGSVMMAGPGVRTLEEAGGGVDFLRQFAGCRVGVPSAGSIHDVILRCFLADHGSPPLEIVHYDWADLIPYACNQGEISAAVGTPPLAVLCERECRMRVVIPPKGWWPFSPSYGIVVRRRVLDRGPLMEVFLRLHEKTCNLIRERPGEAARLTVRALPGLDEALVTKVYGLAPGYCASLPEPYVRSTLAFLPVLRRLGYLDRPLREEEVFDTRVIRAVHPQPHHYRP